MFDRHTAELIGRVPALRGADPSELPKTLTEAYVRVATARTSMTDAQSQYSDLNALETWEDMSSLASAYEAIALGLSDADPATSAAAAFVAAAAHQSRYLARNLIGEARVSNLLDNSMSPEISSILLYLVADANADAAEMAGQVAVGEDPGSLTGALLQSIVWLGQSEFIKISKLDVGLLNFGDWESPGRAASDALHLLLLSRLQWLSNALTSGDEAESVPSFADIVEMSSAEFEVQESSVDLVSLLAGPYQLARLLDLVEPILRANAITGCAPPAGIQPEKWNELTRYIGRRRPILWRNHIDAIERGLLELGTSAVVSFPTGSGKSTVSELKVGAALLAGYDVVFLTPTLALMEQTAVALRNVLLDFTVVAQRSDDSSVDVTSPKVMVMTPESCLSSLSVNTELLDNLGLVVFDEAHLLDGGVGQPDQRALDAMLCLLSLVTNHPNADVLLISAMIENGEELSQWLGEILGRPTLALDLDWKPTRQARAAVLYRAPDIDALRAKLVGSFAATETLGPGAALKRELTARPYGFFSLRHSWESRRIADYLLLPLTDEDVLLGATGRRPEAWRLTPNVNAVASAIGAQSARAKHKVLVFAQTVAGARAIRGHMANLLPRRVLLTAAEKLLLDLTVEDLGDQSALYIDMDEDGSVSDVVIHHGLLLPRERRLHELLYGRRNGSQAMVATSTISQGMNLPAEVVIIAGDRRFDPSSERMARLQPHEILNAAGRAGRAGKHANGIVLVVPSSVISFDGISGQMSAAWDELQSIFSQGDQCVTINDPLQAVLDDLDSGEPSVLGDYFLRRIGSVGADESQSMMRPEQVVKSSFASFRKRRSGDDLWASERLAVVESLVRSDVPSWVTQVSASTGIPASTVQLVGEALIDGPSLDGSVQVWLDWYFDILAQQPSVLSESLRAGSRALFKGAEAELDEWDISSSRIVEIVKAHLLLWMGGATLKEIQASSIDAGIAAQDSKLVAARKFVLRVVPDLEYLVGLPWAVQRALESEWPILPTTAHLGECVREGVDTLQKLAYHQMSPTASRLEVHRIVRE